MIVIGADTHKRSHALAAVDEGTGRVRGQREITADEPGHLAAFRWARGLDEERVWAIEDCRHVSRRLEQALLAVGEQVVRVAPHRMGASLKGERERGKSDQIDALVELPVSTLRIGTGLKEPRGRWRSYVARWHVLRGTGSSSPSRSVLN
jgi:transposase